MGWRFRKRIKLFPGIFLNISKSGLGLNVGVKGANVTFGPTGTYVNTGIPGTGLYRRDKVENSASNGTHIQDEHDKPKETEENSQEILVSQQKPLSIPHKDVSTAPKTLVQAKLPESQQDINVPYNPKLDLENYKYPPLSLLVSNDITPAIDTVELNTYKDKITRLLRFFGVEISSIKATIGPTITLYEIVPVEGTRFSKIFNLKDDIALSFGVSGIRVIAPISGKETIGIEIPNKRMCIVSMESIVSSKVYQNSTMELPCAVGKTITNEVFMFDLVKAPHLLVAGSTGQGKSMALNVIITSLLYKKHPAELKLVLMDPLGTELGLYHPIAYHFLAALPGVAPIITNSLDALNTLNGLYCVMSQRYQLLVKADCRNIKEYNAQFKERKLNPEYGHEFMPYIVVAIDSYDLLAKGYEEQMMQKLTELSSYARAVGIHLIISTKRPSSDIISSKMKSLIPTRISFRVPEKIDSQVILDCNGAENLVRPGDMLFLSNCEPIRVQCAYLYTSEVRNICQYIAKQQGYLHPMYLPEAINEEYDEYEDNGAAYVDINQLDPLFAEVVKFVVNTQQGSTSMIQRNYSIGYNRAGKIMDQLEKMGVVGPQIGSKPRDVLIKDPITLELLIKSIE